MDKLKELKEAYYQKYGPIENEYECSEYSQPDLLGQPYELCLQTKGKENNHLHIYSQTLANTKSISNSVQKTYPTPNSSSYSNFLTTTILKRSSRSKFIKINKNCEDGEPVISKFNSASTTKLRKLKTTLQNNNPFEKYRK